jgi:hypothetical protein
MTTDTAHEVTAGADTTAIQGEIDPCSLYEGEIDPSELSERDMEDIIGDLKERGVEPDFKFEKWDSLPFYRAYIRAWLLPDNGIEVYEVGSDAVYSFPGADYIGYNGKFDSMTAVEMFLGCDIFRGENTDPALIANILGAGAIQESNPEDPGPVVVLAVTDYDGDGQSVTRWSGDDTQEGTDQTYASYADAQAAINASDRATRDASGREDGLVYRGYGVIAYRHKIVPVDFKMTE